jgi:hypothetical protein
MYVRTSSAAVKSLDDLLEDHAVTQMIGILAYLLPALRRFRVYEERKEEEVKALPIVAAETAKSALAELRLL